MDETGHGYPGICMEPVLFPVENHVEPCGLSLPCPEHKEKAAKLDAELAEIVARTPDRTT